MSDGRDFSVTTYRDYHASSAINLLGNCGWHGSGLPTRAVLRNASARGAAFVAVSDARVIGFARVISDGVTVSYLCELATDQNWRAYGVASALLDACQDVFPAARMDLLSTEVAVGFYERVGFSRRQGFRRWPK